MVKEKMPLMNWESVKEHCIEKLKNTTFLINMRIIIALSMLTLLLNSCYTFKGISISPDINTYFVGNFDHRALNAPADIHVLFGEALRNKIRNESRLKLSDENADIIFEGEVNRFDVLAEAPIEGNTVALNKLEIGVQIKYMNEKNEKESYTKNFTFFRTFPGDQDLQSVQDALIKDIFDQLTEKIFNETFTTW